MNSDKNISITDFIDFNPVRPLKKGTIAAFVDMAALSVNSRDVSEIGQREFTGSGSKFQNGDTLFARITPCLENGKTAKIMGIPNLGTAHGSTEFIVMAAKDPENDADFVYYLSRLPEFRTYAQTHMEGTSGRQRVGWQSLAQFEYDFPQPKFRKKIGQILREIDDKIELNRQTNQTLEQVAQAMFKSWFVDFEPTRAKIAAIEAGATAKETERAAMCAISGKTDEELDQLAPEVLQQLKATAALFPDALVESELGEIPEGWEVKKIGNYLDTVSKTFPLKSVSEVIFLNTGDIQNGKFLHSDKSDVSTLPGQAKKSIQKDDILYSEIRPENRRFAYVYFDTPKHVVSTKLMVLRATNEIPSLYLYFIVTQQSTIDYLQMLAESRSGTFPQITFEAMKNVEFVGPCNNFLFEEFVNAILDPFFKSQQITDKENEYLAELRDTLLPKLLSGEIKVSNVN